MHPTRRSALAILLAAGLMLAGCVPTPAQPGASKDAAAQATVPRAGGAVTIAVALEASTLDAHKPNNTTRLVARALYNSLTKVDARGIPQPELAESWSAPDARTWEFKLRKGVKFHDGTDFDAAAVKFNMDRVLDPATGAFFRTDLYPNVTAVEVVDPSTVRFKMANADATLPARLSGRAGDLVSPAAVEKWGAEYSLHPVGTGPFEFVEWVKDDHLTLKRNPSYWEKDAQGNQLPYLETLTYRPIPDPSVQLTALRTGQVDVIDTLLPADLARVKSEPSLVAVESVGTAQTLYLNMSRPPFDSKALRHAVAWATDYEAIHKGIFFSSGSSGTYLVPPGTWAYDANGAFYTRDLGKAKAALAEAGQPNGFKFEAIVNNFPVPVQYAQAMKSQLAEVGIDMSIVPLESAANSARRTSGDFEGAFSIAPPAPDPDVQLYSFFRTDQSSNRSRYANPKMDELLEKARAISDQQERQKLYYEIQALALDDLPVMVVHTDPDIKVMKSSVQGLDVLVGGYIAVNRIWVKS